MNRFCRGIILCVARSLWRVVLLFSILLPATCYLPAAIFAQTPTVNIVGPTVVTPAVPGVNVLNASGGAVIIYPGSQKVDVNAHVGEFKVSIAGLASPNASVILKDEKNQFLASTVADSAGGFGFAEVNVKNGFSGFCLEQIDFKRLGESAGCLNFEPIQKSEEFREVYVPPTIGLYKTQINANDEALIYGYSMPEAQVNVKIKENQTVDVAADKGGYYEYEFDKVPAGTYELESRGKYQNKDSLEPKKSAKLVARSSGDQLVTRAEEIGKTISDLLTTSIFGFLMLLFFLLIIIIFLIILLKRGGMAYLADKLKPRHPLHHDWLLEFIMNSN